MNNDNDISLIGRYFDGDLNGQEIKEFEKRLNGDPTFYSLFRQEKLLIQGIISSGKKNLLNRLKNLEKSLPKIDASHEGGKVISMTKVYWAAASIVAIFSISSVLFYVLNTQTSTADLYAEYYQPYPNVISVTQRGEETELNELEKGFHAYENSFFEEAIKHFEKAMVNNDTPILKFYMGSSFMGLNKTKEAIVWFEKVADSSSGLYDQANWYLALCYLRENKVEKTKYYLSKLQENNGGSYTEKANKLMDELD